MSEEGAASGANIWRVEDSPITVKLDEPFTISLDVQATTGYVWQPSFSPSNLILENDSFATPEHRIGGSGQQLLTFRPVKAGPTQINLELRRSWENEARRTLSVEVIVTKA
jgi:predicted secreted protein